MTPFLGPFIEPLMNQDTKITIKIISLKNKTQGRQPIMIGRYKDNTNKNRKLAVSAGHRPDGEET